jgi:hypothetical protein
MFFKKLACWLLKMKGTCGFALIFRVMAPDSCILWREKLDANPENPRMKFKPAYRP